MTENQAAAWLVARVKAAPSLAALGGRILPDAAPDGTPNPCLIYQLVSANSDDRLDAGEMPDRLAAYQIRIYAGTRAAANELRAAFRRLMQNIEPATLNGWRLDGTAWGDGDDTFDPASRDYGATGVLEIHGE